MELQTVLSLCQNLWRHRRHKVLMYLEFKAIGINFRRVEQTTCLTTVSQGTGVRVLPDAKCHESWSYPSTFCAYPHSNVPDFFPKLQHVLFVPKLNQTAATFS